MKKRIVMVIALVLTAFMVCSACASTPEPTGAPTATPSAQAGNEASAQPQDEPASASPTPQAEQPADGQDGAAQGVVLSEYAAIMQEMLDSLSELYGEAMKIEATTQGDSTLVITYTLLDDSLGLTAENITQSMEAEGSKMVNQAELMEAGGIASPEVVVKWIDTDGSELFNRTYTLP